MVNFGPSESGSCGRCNNSRTQIKTHIPSRRTARVISCAVVAMRTQTRSAGQPRMAGDIDYSMVCSDDALRRRMRHRDLPTIQNRSAAKILNGRRKYHIGRRRAPLEPDDPAPCAACPWAEKCAEGFACWRFAYWLSSGVDNPNRRRVPTRRRYLSLFPEEFRPGVAATVPAETSITETCLNHDLQDPPRRSSGQLSGSVSGLVCGAVG